MRPATAEPATPRHEPTVKFTLIPGAAALEAALGIEPKGRDKDDPSKA